MTDTIVDPVELTKALVRIETTNPPGNEERALAVLGELLAGGGFDLRWHRFEPGRANLVATLPGTGNAFLGFTGHLDTVPVGETPWRHPPFAAQEEDGRIYGRGSSDMKSGVAAFVCAALDAAKAGRLERGLALILTAGEERGSEGLMRLRDDGVALPRLAGLVVAEPTSNRLSLGHKGALFLRVTTRGVTAHSSMPQEGDNAVYRLAEAVLKVRDMVLDVAPHPVLGAPSRNVALVSGGHALNAVPDLASFTMDFRTIPGQDHADLLAALRAELGPKFDVEVIHDLPPVWTDSDDAFVGLCGRVLDDPDAAPLGMPFFTDGSVLKPMTGAPTVILGPGEPTQAHKTDEWCRADDIRRARDIYARLIAEFGRGSQSV